MMKEHTHEMTDKNMTKPTNTPALPGTTPQAAQSDVQAPHVLAAAVSDVAPPADLFDRIEATLDATDDGTGVVSIRAQDGEWSNTLPGIWVKLVSTRPDGIKMQLVRCDPGATIPAHHHKKAEQVFVLEGAFNMGGLVLNAGDAQLGAANTDHPDIYSESGCLLLIVA